MAELCEICHQLSAKYKCPSCELPTCSLPCSKTHKVACNVTKSFTSSTPPEQEPVSSEQNQTRPPLGECFKELAESSELEALLLRYPSLKQQLASIYGTTLEPTHPARQVQQGQHRGYNAGSFRGTNRGRSSNVAQGQWTQQKGDNAALRRIKHARESAYEEYGQGMREFLSLVQMKCGPDSSEMTEPSITPSAAEA